MIRKFQPSELETKAFRDHHSYTIEDENVLNSIAKNFDFLVCTEKDLIKISNPPNQLRILLLKSKLDQEDKFISFLQEKIYLKIF